MLPAAAAARDGANLQTLENRAFQVAISVADGQPRLRVIHRPSGIALADAPYSYALGAPVSMRLTTGRDRFALEGVALGHIRVTQEIHVPAGAAWIEEEFTITNAGTQPIDLGYPRTGFVVPVRLEGREATGPLKHFKFIAIPFRREPSGDRAQYADYTVGQVLTESRFSYLRATRPEKRSGTRVNSTLWGTGLLQNESREYASEGWCLTDGRRGFVISKYSQEGMEWAVVDRMPLSADSVGLRWGGIGLYFGDPERGARLGPGETYRFGVTRLTAYDGGVNEGFYAFRAEMESRGHACPRGFDPPSHWNELYDNKLWWLPNGGAYEAGNKKKYYTLADMREEAAKAQQMGCEALYLDPGWDTSFASKIWDESRLGKMADFVRVLKRDFGLKLSLHTPLSGWCDSSSYPRAMDRMGRDGRRVDGFLCGASRQYVEETGRRLDALAREGATFFMFDGTAWCGECWDPSHGHAVPSRRQEHVDATNQLARLVHETHPGVLIEMHGQMLGGTYMRYVPIYHGHGRRGFDLVWAFELMWDPMRDLLSGHSIALYYFNLAYSMPLYIHIDLRGDNAQALMLWWNISTCRQIGMGGTHKDPATRKAHQDAMAAYRRLKTFFASGVFYGIDEQTHLHRHPTESRAVINCFNLEERPVTRALDFEASRFGLDTTLRYEVPREVTIPAHAHVLIEVNPLK
jgi:hypothetical protein